MAMVESRQFRFSQTLDDRKNGGVNKAKRETAIAIEQFTDAPIVLRLEIDDFKPALLGVSQEAQKRIWTKALAGKPIQLNDHWSWDEHLLIGRLQ